MNYGEKIVRNVIIFVLSLILLIPCTTTIIIEKSKFNKAKTEREYRIENLHYQVKLIKMQREMEKDI